MKILVSRTNRLIRFISILTVTILSFNGLPCMVLAEELNAPDYYSVQSGLAYEITTNITSSWINHVSVDFVLANTGDETIHNWYLTINTPYSIDNVWNGSLYETDGNGTYTLTSNGWNQDIHPGESVTVGATFSSDTETELTTLPGWYLLNTSATVIDPAQYSLDYTEYSIWEGGFTGQLTLEPQIDCPHWSLTFTSNRQITAVSSAVLNTEDDDTYEITHDENNMRLYANNEYDFGIQGIDTEDSIEFTDVELTVVDLAYHLTDDNDNNGIPDYLEFMGMGVDPVEPTPTPTDVPTETPTDTPTTEPTNTEMPTEEPTETPTETPTDEPTETPTETVTPTEEPTPTIDPEADQDLDGLPDYIEDQLGTDSLKADTDDDLLTDYIEVMIGYDPTNPDTDNNGIIDGNEDYDNDGLINAQEIQIGTELTFEDTDWDHLTDGDEVNIYGTNPLVADTDNDGIEDGDEVEIGKNPLDCADGSIRVIQSISRDIDNVEDLAIDSVDVTATLANNIDRVLKIRDYYNVDIYSTDVYGRIGSPINFECEESFDTATVVFHYDDTQLGETDENDLGVLWYDESNGIYVVQEQAVIDTQNNTITLTLSHFSTYVVVDLNMWNNPVVPDYSNYIMVVEEETSSYYWHDEERDLDSKEHECFVWWKLSHGSQYQIVQRLFGDMHCEDTSKILQLWYINFTWLVMDMTDGDEDGVLDYMETQGVLGTNNHIYYSDPTVEDGDGDTLTDNEEFGVRYTVFRTMDGALYIMLGLTVVYESPDGVIDPDSQYYILHNYFDVIPCGYGRTISVIRSDAELIDSDGDLDNDFIDPKPTRRHLNDRLVYNISLLEDIANEYNPNLDYKQLVFSFIRSFWPNYCTALWDGTGGIIDDEFKNYISTYYPELYSYFETTSVYYADYSGNLGDFYHFAATMNGLIYESDYSSCTDDDYKLAFQLLPEGHIDNLAGWAGDYQQFVRDNVVDYVNIYCDYSSMYDYVYSQLFMGASESSFSMDDLYADVDALNVSLANDNETLSDTMRIYFDESINQRFTLFVDHADLNKLSDYSSVAYIVNIFGWTRWPLYRGYNVESLSSDQWNAIMDAFVDRLNYLSGIE